MHLFVLTTRISALLLSMFVLLTPIRAASSSATSFCKCTCFTNSTIIALNPPLKSTSNTTPAHLILRNLLFSRDVPTSEPPKSDEGSEEDGNQNQQQHHRLTCADCNRAFCLDYNLPICKGAKEEDVFTTCFQRDSLKDEMVVVLFLFTTVGLLGWALIRPWIERLRDPSGGFVPISGPGR